MRLLCPWDFPGKSTGVGCRCLLQVRVIDMLSTLLPGSILLLQLLIGKIMLDNNLTLSRNAYLKLHAFFSYAVFQNSCFILEYNTTKARSYFCLKSTNEDSAK